MFLTSFDINLARRRAQAIVSSPRAMHGAVQAAFPAGALNEGRALWRIDTWPDRTVLYIVSPTEPDLTHLVEQAGWPSLPAAWRTSEYGPFLDALKEGDAYQFRLEANPVRSAAQPNGGRGKRFGHVTLGQQWEWFARRSSDLGIHLGSEGEPSGQVASRAVKTFRRESNTVTLSTAVFDGTLVVTDVDRLRSALTTGVGPAKAYGCGLLTLARGPRATH